MEDVLLPFVPVVLAVGIAVFLRMRKRIREASEEAAALRKKVAVLEQRTLQLEGAQWKAGASARNISFPKEAPARPAIRRDRGIRTRAWWGRSQRYSCSPQLTESQKEVAEVLNQLYVMKAQLPQDTMVEEKYIAEFDSIVDRLERATGCDLSRWLGIPPPERQSGAASPGQKARFSNGGLKSRDRTLFRLRIVSLQAFCDYQASHLQGFVAPPPGASRLIH
jgi:hypothetical protein